MIPAAAYPGRPKWKTTAELPHNINLDKLE